MKVFLNVIGLLAMIGAFTALFAARSAVQEIEAGISLLICCTSFGLAHIIGLQETAAEKSAVRDKAAREHYGAMASLGSVSGNASPANVSGLPPVPGKEVYFISDGERAVGPHNLETLRALLARGTINQDTYILQQGAREWQKLGDMIKA